MTRLGSTNYAAMRMPILSGLLATSIWALHKNCDGCGAVYERQNDGSWKWLSEKHALFCPKCGEKDLDMSVKSLPSKEGFTFGCDPEVFIVDDKGQPVSAEGIIPGTKEEPFRVDNGWVQVDGMAGEFGIDPATDFDSFNDRISSVLGQMKKMLPKGHSLSIVPSVEFPESVFVSASEKAKELGCNPDFNAWTGDVHPPPDTSNHPRLRTAAGHIHIGWGDGFSLDDPQHIMNCQDLAKQLDWYLGAWSLKIDTDDKRRLLYGKAGAIRYKPYGVEYRVLSNFWLTTKERRLVVWNRMQSAIRDMAKRFLPDYYAQQYNDLLRSSIDESKLDPKLQRSCHFPITSYSDTY